MRFIPCKSALRIIAASLALDLLLLALAGPASASQLSDFERDATTRRESNSSDSDTSSSKKSSPAEDIVSDIAGDCLSQICLNAFGDLFKAMAVGGTISMRRIEDESYPVRGSETSQRKSGDALLPFFRYDITNQDVQGDVTARDSRFEAGYGAIAVQARKTVYHEQVPTDKMEISEQHVLFRMSVTNDFEIDLGAGFMTLKGMQTTTGVSVTLPILFHPSEHLGLELRPVWSSLKENTIQDTEVAVLFGWRYASLKAGYRWMHSPRRSLDGPVAGISLRW